MDNSLDWMRFLALPAQHFEKDYDLECRSQVRAARIIGRDATTNEPIYDRDTFGDLLGFVAWRPATPSARPIAGWMHGWPTIVTTPASNPDAPEAPSADGEPAPTVNGGTAPGTTTRNAPGTTTAGVSDVPATAMKVQPLYDGAMNPDQRFEERGPALPDWSSKFPKNWTGRMSAGSVETDQAEIFHPDALGVVASEFGTAGPHLSTQLFDLDPHNAVDPSRNAPLHRFMRGVKGPTGLGMDGRNGIAWQIGYSQSDGSIGLGLVADAAPGAAPTAPGAGPASTGNPNGDAPSSGDTSLRGGALPTVPTFYGGTSASDDGSPPPTSLRDPPAASVQGKGVLGATGWRGGGPFLVRGPGSPHDLGTSADGENISSTLLSTDSVFGGSNGDASILFEGGYVDPGPQPMRARGHLMYDPKDSHPWVGGARGGRYKILVEQIVYIPPPIIEDPNPHGGDDGPWRHGGDGGGAGRTGTGGGDGGGDQPPWPPPGGGDGSGDTPVAGGNGQPPPTPPLPPPWTPPFYPPGKAPPIDPRGWGDGGRTDVGGHALPPEGGGDEPPYVPPGTGTGNQPATPPMFPPPPPIGPPVNPPPGFDPNDGNDLPEDPGLDLPGFIRNYPRLFPPGTDPNEYAPGSIAASGQPLVLPSDQAPKNQPFAASAMELAVPGILLRPQPSCPTAVDLRNNRAPSTADMQRHDKLTPIAGNLAASSVRQSCTPTINATSGQSGNSRYAPGTTSGALTLFPAEVGIQDDATDFAPKSIMRSNVAMGVLPVVGRIFWGLPHTRPGGSTLVRSGFSSQVNAAGALVHESHDATSANTTEMTLDKTTGLALRVPLAKTSTLTTTVYNDQSNAYSAGTQDFSGVTLKVPAKADPASPVTAEMWINKTTSLLKYRDTAGSPATHIVEIQDNKDVAGGYLGAAASTGYLKAAAMPILGGDVTSSGGNLGVTVTGINGASLGTTTPASGNLLIGSGSAWATRALSGDVTIGSTGVAAVAKLNGVGAANYARLDQGNTFATGTNDLSATTVVPGLIQNKSGTDLTIKWQGAATNQIKMTDADGNVTYDGTHKLATTTGIWDVAGGVHKHKKNVIASVGTLASGEIYVPTDSDELMVGV